MYGQQPERERALEPLPFLTTAGRPPRTASRVMQDSLPRDIETICSAHINSSPTRTLSCMARPEQPWERLNALVQGSIVHRVLERSHRERRRVADVFEDVFADYCAEACVPEGYRTEAVRLELLYNLEMMEADSTSCAGMTSLYEEPFTLELGEGAIPERQQSIVSRSTRTATRRSSTTSTRASRHRQDQERP